MLIPLLISIIVFLLVGTSWLLWKSGFLYDAEKPKILIDNPVEKPKERKFFLKRLRRWREEGKISREEFENFSHLCDSDWD